MRERLARVKFIAEGVVRRYQREVHATYLLIGVALTGWYAWDGDWLYAAVMAAGVLVYTHGIWISQG